MNEETIYPSPFAPTEQKKYVKVIGDERMTNDPRAIQISTPSPAHNFYSQLQALSIRVQRLEERMEKLIELAEVHRQAVEAIAATLKEE